MVKLTKRKGFNFFRSYYDVYNELNDKDKVKFMDALLDRQFLGVKPTELEGMAKFAYISQTNSIDSQVRGYEDKTGTKLTTPTQGGAQGGNNPPSLQVEEKVEEKGKGEYTHYSVKLFLTDWNELRLKHLKKPSHIKTMPQHDKTKFSEVNRNYSQEDFQNAMIGLFKQKTMPHGNSTMQSNPGHFLNYFNSYLTAYYDQNEALYGT